MAKPGSVIGWKLPSDERDILLRRFPPRYDNTIADHVTLRTGGSGVSSLAPVRKVTWSAMVLS